ncbi:MAG: hypothetical protein HYV59_16415 [Planctomycetes bacterium]|nr:hypothetical protein [Planctomycetota bacterium]
MKKSNEVFYGKHLWYVCAEWSGASAGAQRSTHAYVPEEKQMNSHILSSVWMSIPWHNNVLAPFLRRTAQIRQVRR